MRLEDDLPLISMDCILLKDLGAGGTYQVYPDPWPLKTSNNKHLASGQFVMQSSETYGSSPILSRQVAYLLFFFSFPFYIIMVEQLVPGISMRT